MIALGDVAIIGGGCYGSFYAGQLAKAHAKGTVTWRRLLLVDRDAGCAVVSSLATLPDAELVVAEWGEFLDRWLDEGSRRDDDQIVPSPLMPHLLAQWLTRRAADAWPQHRVAMVKAEAVVGTPFDWLHPEDGVRYVSFADWLCPTHCIEPAICPVIAAPRTWEMGDAVAAWTDARRVERPTAGPALFTCRHMVHGVGMYRARLAFDGLAALAAQMAVTPGGADLVVGSVSACHGAVGVLRVTCNL
jgi:hypothetical protein